MLKDLNFILPVESFLMDLSKGLISFKSLAFLLMYFN